MFNGQPNWYNNGAIVQNPAATSTNGLPYYIHVRNTGQAQYTQGGLIRGNTAGGTGSTLAANTLTGTQFVGAGQPDAVRLRHCRRQQSQCLLCRLFGQCAEPALCPGVARGSLLCDHRLWLRQLSGDAGYQSLASVELWFIHRCWY